MKTVIITALVTVSVTFTAHANLPPTSGSPTWAEIQIFLDAAPEREDTVCEFPVPNADRTARLPATTPHVSMVEHGVHPAAICSSPTHRGPRGRSDWKSGNIPSA